MIKMFTVSSCAGNPAKKVSADERIEYPYSSSRRFYFTAQWGFPVDLQTPRKKNLIPKKN